MQVPVALPSETRLAAPTGVTVLTVTALLRLQRVYLRLCAATAGLRRASAGDLLLRRISREPSLRARHPFGEGSLNGHLDVLRVLAHGLDAS